MRTTIHSCVLATLAVVTACGDSGDPSEMGEGVGAGTGGGADEAAADGADDDAGDGVDDGPEDGADDGLGSGDETGDSSGEDGESDGGRDDTATGEFCEGDTIWEARFEDFEVPTSVDQYICRGFTVEPDQLSHAISFSPHITDQHVHHIILYKVAESFGPGYSPCFHGPDWVFQFGWAPGVQQFDVPPEAGFPVGDGEFGLSHYVLEIHYNNPGGDAGAVDSSGIDVCLTQDLRPNDASVLGLGDVPGIAIPPGEPAWEETGECPSTATQLALPPGGLTVFGSMLHAHRLATAIYTEQYRAGVKIGELGRDDMFDFNYQQVAAVEGEILPGDSMTTTCVYDSTDETQTTNGGEGSDDEMCLNFLMYYPAIAYPACFGLGGGGGFPDSQPPPPSEPTEDLTP